MQAGQKIWVCADLHNSSLLCLPRPSVAALRVSFEHDMPHPACMPDDSELSSAEAGLHAAC